MVYCCCQYVTVLVVHVPCNEGHEMYFREVNFLFGKCDCSTYFGCSGNVAVDSLVLGEYGPHSKEGHLYSINTVV